LKMSNSRAEELGAAPGKHGERRVLTGKATGLHGFMMHGPEVVPGHADGKAPTYIETVKERRSAACVPA
jgi:hypothetical protein